MAATSHFIPSRSLQIIHYVIKTHALHLYDTQTKSDSEACYLVGTVGVHLDHVLSALLHFELDVVLLLECGQATAVGAAWSVWGQRAF